jgi:hypothetical protein
MMKIAVILLVAGVMVGTLAATSPAVDTNQAFLWNGVHWQQVTTEGKAGYIFGIGNLADYEAAASKGRPMVCVSRVFVEEMKTKTVMQIIQEVDRYYQDNPVDQVFPGPGSGRGDEEMKQTALAIIERRSGWTVSLPPRHPGRWAAPPSAGAGLLSGYVFDQYEKSPGWP